MRPTRRGFAALGVAVVGMAMATAFEPRSLNAVVFPLVVGVVAGLAQVWMMDAPQVRRRMPAAGFPGDERRVTLEFETDAPFAATVRDRLPAGIDGEATAETGVGTEPVTYDVRYADRGEHAVGPVSVVGRDVLGLARRTFTCGTTDAVVVYPRLYRLGGAVQRELRTLFDPDRAADRDEFDRLREYARGDSRRDIHWKSSAKRGDLMVAEYAADANQRVTMSAGGAAGRGDEMAEAAASLATALLDIDIPVRLSTPSGVVEATPGDRTRLLEHLARAGDGPPPDPGADVVVDASTEATAIRFGGRETTFDRLRAGGDADTAAPVDGRRAVA